MRKHVIRLSICILTFCIGTATTFLSTWIRANHASEMDRPYSVLEGSTVRILPYNATFEIPEGWLTPNPMPPPAKNLYLSRQDLDQLSLNDGSDWEEAQVINAVLPFAQCAAHFGDKGWGNYLWDDLQGRVYFVDSTPKEIATMIKTRGLQESLTRFKDASLSWENYGVWQKLTINILDAPTHFSLMKNLEFYYRPFNGKTVVFVFLHAGGFEHTIERILSSFDCPACYRTPRTETLID
ncbi:MAG TPA: hypothetical protein VF088_00750 [Pyrinomonadaceae bacterium]